MLRLLERGDTAATLELLRARPLHNVYMDYLVQLGALGSLPGFQGYFRDRALEGVMLIAANGGTCLEVRSPDACAPLAEAAWASSVRPRHIVGPEEVTTPFWQAYAREGLHPTWERREPVYLLERSALASVKEAAAAARLERARTSDLEQVVENSARQYLEDLKLDRQAEDPTGFDERHRFEIRDGRWWVLRVDGRVAFQVHVGPENDRVVQIGGVFTPADLRGRGLATRGVAALAERLLRRLPAVSLFCDEANRGARRVYERVGFRERFHYRSWLLPPH
jgi:predicted GNAT family acetyltransferase